jgi:anthranilate synthase
MRAAVRGAVAANTGGGDGWRAPVGKGRRVLLVDHEDSFVHTLANYVRQTGAEVHTLRTPLPAEMLDRFAPDLVLLSPGPGRPSDFACSETLAATMARGIPVFGVCLGLQAIAEHFGGTLAELDTPMHGKPSRVEVTAPGTIFADLPDRVTVGRYHSLHAPEASLPAELEVTARTADGVVMAIEHRSLPVAAVQFHPESIMALGQNVGLRIIENVVTRLVRRAAAERVAG